MNKIKTIGIKVPLIIMFSIWYLVALNVKIPYPQVIYEVLMIIVTVVYIGVTIVEFYRKRHKHN